MPNPNSFFNHRDNINSINIANGQVLPVNDQFAPNIPIVNNGLNAVHNGDSEQIDNSIMNGINRDNRIVNGDISNHLDAAHHDDSEQIDNSMNEVDDNVSVNGDGDNHLIAAHHSDEQIDNSINRVYGDEGNDMIAVHHGVDEYAKMNSKDPIVQSETNHDGCCPCCAVM